jgi:hypothetical protein
MRNVATRCRGGEKVVSRLKRGQSNRFGGDEPWQERGTAEDQVLELLKDRAWTSARWGSMMVLLSSNFAVSMLSTSSSSGHLDGLLNCGK